METITMKIYTREGIDYITVDVNTISEFGITNKYMYRNDGGFKKFVKHGFLISNGQHFTFVNSVLVTELKRHFKGSFTTTKNTLSTAKCNANGRYIGMREANDYTYKLKTKN